MCILISKRGLSLLAGSYGIAPEQRSRQHMPAFFSPMTAQGPKTKAPDQSPPGLGFGSGLHKRAPNPSYWPGATEEASL